MINLAGVSLQDAVKMATLTPARILKIDDAKGSIDRGKDADIVVFDEDINVRMTIVEGKLVYRLDHNCMSCLRRICKLTDDRCSLKQWNVDKLSVEAYDNRTTDGYCRSKTGKSKIKDIITEKGSVNMALQLLPRKTNS